MRPTGSSPRYATQGCQSACRKNGSFGDNDSLRSQGNAQRGRTGERALAIARSVDAVADELGVTSAQVAVAWVQSQRDVTSTIIGARTLEQLEANVKALDLALPADAVAGLEAKTAPALEFPFHFLEFTKGFWGGGTRINGRDLGSFDLAPQSDAERY